MIWSPPRLGACDHRGIVPLTQRLALDGDAPLTSQSIGERMCH